MAGPLTSERHQAGDFADAMELPHRAGWSDGLPVVPPTERSVAAMLDATGLAPGDVVVAIPERDRVVTAEKVAVNAVMAGCLPEYLPVVVAALEAVTDRRFWFNHLASLGSPWPLVVVNGPIVDTIGLHSGSGVFGPGHRANLTIARAVSLVLRNCAGAKVEDVERAQWGNPLRFAACIAENEATGWEPLHLQRGARREDSAVTVVSCYPGSPGHVRVPGDPPERMLDAVCHAMANWGGAEWARGAYTLLMGPHMAEVFIGAGWSKDRVRDYVFENARSSIAELKRRGAWGKWINLPDEDHEVRPGDESTFVHLFRENPEHDRHLFMESTLEERDVDVLVVVAGGDTGYRMAMTVPYQASANPVTKLVRPAP